MPATVALSSFAGLASAAPGLFASAGMALTGPQSGMYTCVVPSTALTTPGVVNSKPGEAAALRLPEAELLETVAVRPIAA
ncbi:MAG: hypothetical protein IBJ18_02850 [Phycisphaerales bacterium]|nr:hypothetical protein [Phycisphaerales bacterium]